MLRYTAIHPLGDGLPFVISLKIFVLPSAILRTRFVFFVDEMIFLGQMNKNPVQFGHIHSWKSPWVWQTTDMAEPSAAPNPPNLWITSAHRSQVVGSHGLSTNTPFA
jgi:hypothetical protein